MIPHERECSLPMRATSVAIRRDTWHVEPCGLVEGSILAISQTETMYERTEAIEDLGEQAIVRLVVPESLR